MLLRISQVPNCFQSVVLVWVFTHSACLAGWKREFVVNFEQKREENVFMAYFAISHIVHILIGRFFPEAVVQDLHFKNGNLLCDIVPILQVILWSLHAQCTASWNIFGNKILDVCDVVLLVLEWYPFLCTVAFFSCSYYEDLHNIYMYIYI